VERGESYLKRELLQLFFFWGFKFTTEDDSRALNTTKFGKGIGGGKSLVVVMHQKTPQLETMVILVLNRATTRVVTRNGIKKNPIVYNITIK
jgi:hypothetical protein